VTATGRASLASLQSISDDQLRTAFLGYELALRRTWDIDEWIRGSAMTSWEPLLAGLIPNLEEQRLSDPIGRLMVPVAELSKNLAFRNLACQPGRRGRSACL